VCNFYILLLFEYPSRAGLETVFKYYQMKQV